MKSYKNHPRYIKIADYICELIMLKILPVEERIPSVRRLASMLKANGNTVIRSYHFLADKNIIYRQRGKGYQVRACAPQYVRTYLTEKYYQRTLPDIFQTIYLLNISMNEIRERYQQFVQDHQDIILDQNKFQS